VVGSLRRGGSRGGGGDTVVVRFLFPHQACEGGLLERGSWNKYYMMASTFSSPTKTNSWQPWAMSVILFSLSVGDTRNSLWHNFASERIQRIGSHV